MRGNAYGGRNLSKTLRHPSELAIILSETSNNLSETARILSNARSSGEILSEKRRIPSVLLMNLSKVSNTLSKTANILSKVSLIRSISAGVAYERFIFNQVGQTG